MKQILLDTNFIITCVKQKIDFFEELVEYSILIPKQVIQELKGLKEELSIKILEKNKFRKIDIKNKNVDKGIINYAREHNELIVATLDRGIKEKIKNRKLIIRGKKKLMLI